MEVKFLTQQIIVAWPEFNQTQVGADAYKLLGKMKDLKSSYFSVYLINHNKGYV